jgi:PKHD-type hydroxylase
VARYRPGMQYGAHVDAPLMGDAVAWRSDLSLTLFLSPPQDYDGGELALESGSGELQIKLDAGALVLYPTGQLHRVLPVTRGERLVLVAWIESFVRDGEVRGMLHDLAQLRERLAASGADALASALAVKVHANLLRRHAET